MHTPEYDPKERAYRRVLALFTALLIMGLLTAALWPAPHPPTATPPERPSAQAHLPAALLDPHSEERAAQPHRAPAAKPAPSPAGEPSLLVVSGDRACPQIALTYDAGSGADGAAAILDTLKRQKVVATFFLTGKWVEQYPALARRIAAEGHEIANHTYSHPDLTKLAPAAALQEILQGESAIRRITGQETKPLFREPYGAFNKAEQQLVRQAGFLYSIYWDIDTLDWQFPPVDTIVKRITSKAQNGSIILMHLNVPDSAIASEQAIRLLRTKGYSLVRVSQVLRCGPAR